MRVPWTARRLNQSTLKEINPEYSLEGLMLKVKLKSLLLHHSSKASIIWCSAFFMVQFSHPYLTTGKSIALTRLTFVHKVMSLLFNMLSRLVIAFLQRIKCLLTSWLQSPSAVILEPPRIRFASPTLLHELSGKESNLSSVFTPSL